MVSDFLGSISDKTLKVQCLVPFHIVSEKNSLTIILNETLLVPNLQCDFRRVYTQWTLFLTSGSGGEVDSSHHLLNLIFILQYVGSHSTYLVLLFSDQLIQLY